MDSDPWGVPEGPPPVDAIDVPGQCPSRRSTGHRASSTERQGGKHPVSNGDVGRARPAPTSTTITAEDSSMEDGAPDSSADTLEDPPNQGGPAVERTPSPVPPVAPPDDDSVVDDDILGPAGFIVNTRHRLLICQQCGFAVAPNADTLQTHLAKHHLKGVQKVEARAMVTRALTYGIPAELIPFTSTRTDPIPAIYGLTVTPTPYVFCSCSRGFKNVASLKKHRCLSGRPSVLPGTTHFAQSFYGRPNTAYFAVFLPDVVHDPTNPAMSTLLQDTLDAHGPASYPTNVIPELSHTQSQMAFIRSQGWADLVRGLDPARVAEWVSIDEEDPVLCRVRDVCFAFLKMVEGPLQNAHEGIKKAIGRFNP